MLGKLTVQNYALINHLEIDFHEGFNAITGETGSGKSLLLGALGLLLGQQADYSVLSKEQKKTIIEGTFFIKHYKFQPLFKELDIDYDNETIIRRELLVSGKSRAFINDTPVKLLTLKKLSSKLIDIHSQNENTRINDLDFKYEVVDLFSHNSERLKLFRLELEKLKKLKLNIKELLAKEEQLKADKEYFSFQLKELTEAELENSNLESLEDELTILSNAEQLKNEVFHISQSLSNDSRGALEFIKEALDMLRKVKTKDTELEELTERLNTLKVELEDLAYDFHRKQESISPDEERLSVITDKVNTLNTLLIKHRASSMEELQVKKSEFEKLLHQSENFDKEKEALQTDIATQKEKCHLLANDLKANREKHKTAIETFINDGMSKLSMGQAEFKVSISADAEFNHYGADQLEFLIKTNKGSALSSISKIASGGEKSRLMFLLKAAMASKSSIKTIVFDEIDTGISGEVASKLAAIIKGMSGSSQIFTVTHLAQMASKADAHFKVYKSTEGESTQTALKRLDTKAEVLNELAQILSGEKVTEAALKNAASLLSEN